MKRRTFLISLCLLAIISIVRWRALYLITLSPGVPARFQSGIQADLLEHSRNAWKTPIEFYGKVLDEATNPVAGVQIDFDCNDLSSTGTSSYRTESDGNGLFSINNIKGKLLVVKVSKEGYYARTPFGKYFFYAGENENFVPNADAPVIFWLRKKGQGVELVTSKSGLRTALAVRVPITGNSVGVDLLEKKGQFIRRLGCKSKKARLRKLATGNELVISHDSRWRRLHRTK